MKGPPSRKLLPPIKTRKIRCPRCSGVPSELIERWGGFTTTFDYDGERRSAEGYHSEGDPQAVHARCVCGHRWAIRGVTQITDLDVEFSEVESSLPTNYPPQPGDRCETIVRSSEGVRRRCIYNSGHPGSHG